MDPGVYLVANVTCSLESFFVRTDEFRRIIERPMKTLRDAGEDRTTLRLSFAANGNDVIEHLTGFPYIGNALRPVVRNVDSNLLKRFDDERIDCAWFQSGAMCLEEFAADLIQQRSSHLAARAVMNADEQNLLLWHFWPFRWDEARICDAARNNFVGVCAASEDRVGRLDPCQRSPGDISNCDITRSKAGPATNRSSSSVPARYAPSLSSASKRDASKF